MRLSLIHISEIHVCRSESFDPSVGKRVSAPVSECKTAGASKKDFETARRKKFCARIATGDYDAVIIGHSQFEKIPVSAERQERILTAQIDEIENAIAEMKSKNGERFSIKQLSLIHISMCIRDRLYAGSEPTGWSASMRPGVFHAWMGRP